MIVVMAMIMLVVVTMGAVVMVVMIVDVGHREPMSHPTRIGSMRRAGHEVFSASCGA
jgi:hypothetical protein